MLQVVAIAQAVTMGCSYAITATAQLPVVIVQKLTVCVFIFCPSLTLVKTCFLSL